MLTTEGNLAMRLSSARLGSTSPWITPSKIQLLFSATGVEIQASEMSNSKQMSGPSLAKDGTITMSKVDTNKSILTMVGRNK